MSLAARRRAPNGGSRTEDWDVAVTQLDGRVGSIEASLGQIVGEIRGLAAKLEDRGKIQWPAFSLLLGVMTVVGGLVYYPVQGNLARVETKLGEVDKGAATDRDLDKLVSVVTRMSETAVSKADLENRLQTAGARRDDWQRNSELRNEALHVSIEDLRKSVVPRGEHEEHWRAVDRQFADVQRQLDDNKRFETDLYSARDIIRDMNERLRAFEAHKPS